MDESKNSADEMDLFAWAETRQKVTTDLLQERETGQIIDRVAFFRQRKKFFLAIYYRDENALRRPVTGAVIPFTMKASNISPDDGSQPKEVRCDEVA